MGDIIALHFLTFPHARGDAMSERFPLLTDDIDELIQCHDDETEKSNPMTNLGECYCSHTIVTLFLSAERYVELKLTESNVYDYLHKGGILDG